MSQIKERQMKSLVYKIQLRKQDESAKDSAGLPHAGRRPRHLLAVNQCNRGEKYLFKDCEDDNVVVSMSSSSFSCRSFTFFFSVFSR